MFPAGTGLGGTALSEAQPVSSRKKIGSFSVRIYAVRSYAAEWAKAFFCDKSMRIETMRLETTDLDGDFK